MCRCSIGYFQKLIVMKYFLPHWKHLPSIWDDLHKLDRVVDIIDFGEQSARKLADVHHLA